MTLYVPRSNLRDYPNQIGQRATFAGHGKLGISGPLEAPSDAMLDNLVNDDWEEGWWIFTDLEPVPMWGDSQSYTEDFIAASIDLTERIRQRAGDDAKILQFNIPGFNWYDIMLWHQSRDEMMIDGGHQWYYDRKEQFEDETIQQRRRAVDLKPLLEKLDATSPQLYVYNYGELSMGQEPLMLDTIIRFCKELYPDKPCIPWIWDLLGNDYENGTVVPPDTMTWLMDRLQARRVEDAILWTSTAQP